VAQAQANLTKTEDQLRDAELRAEFDGVVTAIQSEVGQVVQAGQTVVTMARPDSREAVVDMPDHLAERLSANTRFLIAAQHDPSIRSAGRLREAGAASDPLTRTRRMRIALDEPQPGLRLGSTVTAALLGVGAVRVEIPAASLIERDGMTSVWLVDPVARAVFPREVVVAGRHGDRIEVSEGLAPGARVAIAGLNSLTPGQSIKIPNEERQ
jgi:RND family efflux transporter MFP subunit